MAEDEIEISELAERILRFLASGQHSFDEIQREFPLCEDAMAELVAAGLIEHIPEGQS